MIETQFKTKQFYKIFILIIIQFLTFTQSYANLFTTLRDTLTFGVCNTEVLNIRESPDKNSKSIGKAVYGQKFNILENKDENWVKVKIDSTDGYLNKKFLNISQDFKEEIRINFIPDIIISGTNLSAYLFPDIFYSGLISIYATSLFDKMFKIHFPKDYSDGGFIFFLFIAILVFVIAFILIKKQGVNEYSSWLNQFHLAYPFFASIFVTFISLMSPDIIFNTILWIIAIALQFLISLIITLKKSRTYKYFFKDFFVSLLFYWSVFYVLSLVLVLFLLAIKTIIILIAIVVILFVLKHLPKPPTEEEKELYGW